MLKLIQTIKFIFSKCAMGKPANLNKDIETKNDQWRPLGKRKYKKENSRTIDPYTPPDIVTSLRNLDIKKICEYISINDVPYYNIRHNRFIKSEIIESFFDELNDFTYITDALGYDLLFKNKYKISVKSQSYVFSPKNGKTKEIVIKNSLGKNILNGNPLFDYLMIIQSKNNISVAICDWNTYQKNLPKMVGDQIKVKIPYSELFWIVHPTEHININVKIFDAESMHNNYIQSCIEETKEIHKNLK